VRGAFTGASIDRAGKFELADGGTFLLDEIGEFPLAVQPKLLRALQEGEIQRVGQNRLLTVDVRLLASTNRDPAAEVAQGRTSWPRAWASRTEPQQAMDKKASGRKAKRGAMRKAEQQGWRMISR
jgi:transcriptional regulator with AAA-type ATPase domain